MFYFYKKEKSVTNVLISHDFHDIIYRSLEERKGL